MLFTVWVSTGEVLPVKLPSPPYTAVIECDPTVKDEIARVAVPAVTVPVPIAVAPSLKVTVPVTVPVAVVLTVAVKVTDWPTTDGFDEETTAAVVAALFTTWLNAGEVLPLKLPSPPYTAVIECEPTAREERVRVAVPAVSVPVPIAVAPSLKVTVPVLVPVAVVLTVAVKVTDWLKVDGLVADVTAVVVAALFTTWLTAAEVLVPKVASPP